MQPSLDGAYVRVRRTGDHIGSLKRMERTIHHLNSDDITIHPNREPPKQRPDGHTEFYSDVIELPEQIFDPRWAVRLGETIYNLRAALDYLVHEMAFLDSGFEQDGTQFPISSKPNRFKTAINRGWLQGINDSHVAAIEALQPYNGGTWLGRLADLSNPDKHRRLTTVRSQNAATGTVRQDPNTPSGIRQMVVEFAFTRRIAFSDGTPVIPLLDSLKAQVTDTIDQFKPEFERQPA